MAGTWRLGMRSLWAWALARRRLGPGLQWQRAQPQSTGRDACCFLPRAPSYGRKLMGAASPSSKQMGRLSFRRQQYISVPYIKLLDDHSAFIGILYRRWQCQRRLERHSHTARGEHVESCERCRASLPTHVENTRPHPAFAGCQRFHSSYTIGSA